MIRNVADVKSFSVEVNANGYIQTVHKLIIKFLDSARKIKNTINDT